MHVHESCTSATDTFEAAKGWSLSFTSHFAPRLYPIVVSVVSVVSGASGVRGASGGVAIVESGDWVSTSFSHTLQHHTLQHHTQHQHQHHPPWPWPWPWPWHPHGFVSTLTADTGTLSFHKSQVPKSDLNHQKNKPKNQKELRKRRKEARAGRRETPTKA
jgi:hypothetical protein